MALTSLYANKMRSLLTMLGIIIGVGAVIALVSVGMGVRSNVTSSIASLGSNMLIISPGSSNRGGVRGALMDAVEAAARRATELGRG